LKIFGFVLKDKGGWTVDPRRVGVFAKNKEDAEKYLRQGYSESEWEIIHSYVSKEKITEGDYI
jgi:hypothetical protein